MPRRAFPPAPGNRVATLIEMSTPPRWLSAEEQLAWRAVLDLVIEVRREMDRGVAAFELDGDDYEILVRISESPDGQLRMAELASQSTIAPSRLSYRVDRLERRGIVERIDCPTDRRGLLATLTSQGRELLDRAAPAHVEGVRTLLIDPLGSDGFIALGAVAGQILASRLEP